WSHAAGPSGRPARRARPLSGTERFSSRARRTIARPAVMAWMWQRNWPSYQRLRTRALPQRQRPARPGGARSCEHVLQDIQRIGLLDRLVLAHAQDAREAYRDPGLVAR